MQFSRKYFIFFVSRKHYLSSKNWMYYHCVTNTPIPSFFNGINNWNKRITFDYLTIVETRVSMGWHHNRITELRNESFSIFLLFNLSIKIYTKTTPLDFILPHEAFSRKPNTTLNIYTIKIGRAHV